MLGKLISKICPFFMVPENSPVNEEKYLENRINAADIYEAGHSKAFYPIIKFNEGKGKVDKLCLIDFKGDEIYSSFELQEIRRKNSIYYVILAYREDKGSDVYYVKGLDLCVDDYKSLLNKVTLLELDYINVKFDVTEKGIDVYCSFKDKQNRNIEFEVKENKDKEDSFGLIAPVGNDSKNPDKFPVIYLKKFNMVRQKGTEIFVKVDGKKLEIIKLMPLCNFKKVYLARYCYFSNIKDLNTDFTGELEPIMINGTEREIEVGNSIYSINMNDGHIEIKCVRVINDNSEMKITFSPAIPDIDLLKNNVEVDGRFSLSVDEIKGIMGGVYSVKKSDSLVNIRMNPQKGWQPMPGKLWMKTYLWNCNIDISNEAHKIKTKWIRNGMNLKYNKLKGK